MEIRVHRLQRQAAARANRYRGPLTFMNWAVAGLIYAALYAAMLPQLGGHEAGTLVARNMAMLLLPPLAPLFVIANRRREWRGRVGVFWGAIAAWAALWF